MKKLIYSQEDLDLILSLEIQEKDKEIERLNNIINSIDTKLIEMGVDDEMLDTCEMYDVNGIELRKMLKELKGIDKE